MTTFAVGDIQGCYREFRELLDKMMFDPASDELWLVGDLVNRGPDNAATLDFVMSLPHTRIVLGNHDLHFLAVATGHQRQHGSDTLDDVLASPRLIEYIEWIRHLPLIHVDNTLGYVMVHAGLPAIWNIDECLARAAEVQHALASDDFNEFLAAMYGNEPSRWRESLTGHDRLRIITNYFTRLRYCTADGELELKHKEKVQPEGYAPWFSFPRPAGESLKILFGHWAALEGHASAANAIALDTGCVWGRTLTGMRLDDATFFQVPSHNR